MISKLKFPIALKRETNLLANASEVENGLNCKCYCYDCKEDLIAINNDKNIQIDHFRHQKDTKCKGTYETYIHWLAKEVFKELKSIELPEIRFKNLYHEYFENFKNFEFKLNTIYNKYSVPKELRLFYKYDFILQKKQTLKFEQCLTEETFKTSKGLYIADIVLISEKTKMLVEPYFSNQIDSYKYEKIAESDLSTLAIDLRQFVRMNNYIFTIEHFKKFIISDLNSKVWMYLRTKKVNALLKIFYIEFDSRIESNIKDFKQYKLIQSQIDFIKNDKDKLLDKMQILRDEMQVLGDEISKLIKKTEHETEKLEKIEKEYYNKYK